MGKVVSIVRDVDWFNVQALATRGLIAIEEGDCEHLEWIIEDILLQLRWKYEGPAVTTLEQALYPESVKSIEWALRALGGN